MKRILLLLLLLAFIVPSYAQLSTREAPISFNHRITGKRSIATVTLPYLDMKKVEEEDKEDEECGMPPRFGYLRQVNYNLKNSGTWTKLSNGDKLWRLKVICPGALSVNFLYDKFWLPEGGKFFVYSADKKHHIGAFTSQNNKGDRDNLRGFATGLVYGSEVILEYYQPKEVVDDAIISISFVVHGYRYIRVNNTGYGQSEFCHVNINCEEGQDWQNEKKAVALILIANSYCTGALINTTENNQKPYLLTANHCLKSDTSSTDYLFYWNYEAPGCYYNGLEPADTFCTHGATVIANYNLSDFALLRLIEDPKNITGYTPYYLGWDRSGNSGNPGVCIHHPKGDVKKISTVNLQPTSSICLDHPEFGTAYWKVYWKTTYYGRHGITEGGSSGSPLLNAAHKIIGQLYGGQSNCANPDSADYFGKFDVSWIPNTNCSSNNRLDCWLDSIGTGQETIKGLFVISDTVEWDDTNQQPDSNSNIRIISGASLTIRKNIVFAESCTIVVESGGTLIVDGATISNVNIDLKTGSTLIVDYYGKIETTNGFYAPVGAQVEVINGRIK